MQQHMMNSVASIPPSHVTTEQIQQCLDENKQLIMLIMENQNVGKFAECAPYQAQLQKNLMNLAKIADAQPPPGGGGAATSYPMSPQPVMQQGNFMQQSQSPHISHSQQQQSPYASKLPFQLSDQQLQMQSAHYQQQQQQQFIQGQMGTRPGPGPNSSVYHTGYARNLMDMRGAGAKQDGSDAGEGDG